MEPSTLILGVAILLIALAVGYTLGRAINSAQRRASPPRPSTPDIETEMAEIGRANRRMEQEINEISTFFVTLPDLVRMLQSSKDLNEIAAILIQLVEAIFEPHQTCVFYRVKKENVLRLADAKGIAGTFDGRLQVDFNEGRVGWVAEHQMVMDSRDFLTAPNFNAEKAGKTGRLKVDLVAPLIDADDNETVGVICFGRPTRYPRNEKKMLKMVADLGSMAIKNAEYNRRIQTLANEDGLTHLYNKRFGAAQLSLAINEAEQRNTPLSVFLFDIDHFKTYNDTNGHVAGDEVLRKVGELIRTSIREEDIAARFGGEEFLVIFPGTDKESGLEAAEKLRRNIEEYVFEHQEKQPSGNLTISGGVAAFRIDSRSSTELVRMADEALYQAKTGGRNQVYAYQSRYLSGEPVPDNLGPSQF